MVPLGGRVSRRGAARRAQRLTLANTGPRSRGQAARGAVVYNPMRVIVDEDHCEVVFTLRRRWGMSDAGCGRDAEAVAATRCGQTGARTPVNVAAARSSTGQDRHPPAQAAVPAGTARTAPPTAEGHMPKPSDGSALRVSVSVRGRDVGGLQARARPLARSPRRRSVRSRTGVSRRGGRPAVRRPGFRGQSSEVAGEL